MDASSWTQEVLGSRELWAGVAGSAAAWAAMAARHRARSDGRGRRAGAVLAAGVTAGAIVGEARWAVVAGLVGAIVLRSALGGRSTRGVGAEVCSIGAVGAVYLCLPDTESVLALAGSVAVAAAFAVRRRSDWSLGAAGVTAGLAVASLTDGSSRASAVGAGLSIALLHAIAVWARVQPGVAVLVVAAMLGLARGAGLGPGWSGPWSVDAVVVVVVGTLLVLARRRPSAHPG